MLIRVRSRAGNFRYELDEGADISELLAKILGDSEDADPSTMTISSQPKGNGSSFADLKGRNLRDLGLRHGDLLFLNYQPKSTTQNGAITHTPPVSDVKQPWESVVEDSVDVYWRAQTGKISRGRDTRFCKHGANGMCDYCLPLEPYDAAYHKENNIKHLSYHAYLRKITPTGAASATTKLPPLTPLSYKVKVPCPTDGHLSWPAGICTSCQPSAITLSSQSFRMVDHLEIASREIVDRFLQAWRKTGLQRFGWLLGRYEPYEKVPMGVKAVVEAIHEPPQEGELDGLTLGLPWEDESIAKEYLAGASTPLTIVGFVFTDLEPSPEDRTKNVYKRHPNSFFLSSLEVIFAATLQKRNSTVSRSSSTGNFSSRLVTAVLTANEDGQIDIAAYQVSEQAVAMVDADMIEASVEPGIVRVKDDDRGQGSARYVPEVFYTYKNEYGLEVKKSAKPSFPVEFLILNVTHGFPQQPCPMFQSSQFNIENRPGLEDQSTENVLSNLVTLEATDSNTWNLAKPEEFQKKIKLAKWLSDWHLIFFLGTTQVFSSNDINVLVRTMSNPRLLEDPSLMDPLLTTESWQTLMAFAQEYVAMHPSTSFDKGEDIPPEILRQIAAEEATSTSADPGLEGGGKLCPHCTFQNSANVVDCEVCGLPV